MTRWRKKLIHHEGVPDDQILNNIVPFIDFPAGTYIQDDLDALGLSREEFADRLPYDNQLVYDLLDGKARLTGPMAAEIQKIIGTPAYMLMGFQEGYDEWLEYEREHSLRGRLQKVAGTLRKVAAL